MNHLDVLREVSERGLSLTVSGEDLRLQGSRQRVDAGLVEQIKSVKAELIEYLTAATADRADPREGFPLTLLQRGYLIGRGASVEMGNVASHIYHEIDGCWDIDRLQAALHRVVAHHGMLRTRYTAEGRQVTDPEVDVRIGRLDLRGEPAAEQRARLARLREQRSHRILPSDVAPMLAVDVTLLADDKMRLHVGHDGLVMDGISMFLFFRDWWAAYTAGGSGPSASGSGPSGSGVSPGDRAPGDTVSPRASTDDAQPQAAGGSDGASFADYVAAIEAMTDTPPARRSRAYWLDRLADLPPRPGLPLAASPSAFAQPRFVQHVARLGPPAWAAIKERASSAGLTPTAVLFAAYAETLARWGGGTRFTLTTTVANRPPIHPDIASAIGNFSQTLLVEIDIDRRLTFAERARAVQSRLRRDIDHRHFSGIEVLRELARREDRTDARMPFTFNSTIGYVLADLDGSTIELFGPEVYTSSQTPQVWLNAFAFEQHGGVVIQFDEVSGLFPDGYVSAMVGGYQRLLDSLAADSAWSATTFDLLPEDQRARRKAANDTAGPMPKRPLHDAFVSQAALTPDAPAIVTSADQLSYGELAALATSAASWLRDQGVGRDELVGLIMRRGPEQVVGILAALMAGGAYLPVDADLPEARIRYMLRDGKVRCALTNTTWRPDTGSHIAALALTATTGPEGRPPGPAQPPLAPLPGASPDDLAYVLYTSGTTGEPKGVMVSHRSAANVVADCNARFGIGPADRFIAVSAFNFDLSVYDIFGALSAGAALVLPDADRATDAEHLLDLCAAHAVTVWNSVPALAALLTDQSETNRKLGALRLVMMSGDRIPPNLPAALRQFKPDLTLMSLGGPTETTIWNVSHPIDAGNGANPGGRPPGTPRSVSIPYGRPNANNRAYILDADGLDTPDWVTGEICAAGAGLARGYWADDERTSARFWFDERRGERLYRTGDLGRYLPDGNIDIAGRTDFQIKINGYRIEAGEVETRLTGIDEVKQAIVVRQAGALGDRLVAHLVPAGDSRPAEDEIRRALRVHLPDYMTPSVVVWHESLPLTANGKVDRGRLTAMTQVADPQATAAGSEPTELERELADLWASVLRVPPTSIGPTADFFDLGGDSLAAARIFTGVRKRYGVGLTLDRLYQVQTVRAMAGHVEAERGAGPGGTTPGTPREAVSA